MIDDRERALALVQELRELVTSERASAPVLVLQPVLAKLRELEELLGPESSDGLGLRFHTPDVRRPRGSR